MQSPTELLKMKGDCAEMDCYESGWANMIMWYKQTSERAGIDLIGFLFNDLNATERSYEKHFYITGFGNNSTLHFLKPLQPEDSAVYFCSPTRRGTQVAVHTVL